jgi:two-component system, chemotaxis family, response regulator Rcp1
MGADPIQILLVEDSPGDVNLTLTALADARVANEVHVVGDGEEAMAYLRQAPPFQGSPRPDLVLLDLNLPLMDGREVLAAMKADPNLGTIPVVILTTSAEETDVINAYRLHAASYVTKPVDFVEFVQAVRSIEGFWLSIVKYAPS